ncbi:hypothetical protein C8R45DRAFT_1165225 [Mycena sanguinolenta]|nr:hypothetical protein C8R45DRAFT_1165225 [Mycena sanguinolenta]
MRSRETHIVVDTGGTQSAECGLGEGDMRSEPSERSYRCADDGDCMEGAAADERDVAESGAGGRVNRRIRPQQGTVGVVAIRARSRVGLQADKRSSARKAYVPDHRSAWRGSGIDREVEERNIQTQSVVDVGGTPGAERGLLNQSKTRRARPTYVPERWSVAAADACPGAEHGERVEGIAADKRDARREEEAGDARETDIDALIRGSQRRRDGGEEREAALSRCHALGVRDEHWINDVVHSGKSRAICSTECAHARAVENRYTRLEMKESISVLIVETDERAGFNGSEGQERASSGGGSRPLHPKTHSPSASRGMGSRQRVRTCAPQTAVNLLQNSNVQTDEHPASQPSGFPAASSVVGGPHRARHRIYRGEALVPHTTRTHGGLRVDGSRGGKIWDSSECRKALKVGQNVVAKAINKTASRKWERSASKMVGLKGNMTRVKQQRKMSKRTGLVLDNISGALGATRSRTSNAEQFVFLPVSSAPRVASAPL